MKKKKIMSMKRAMSEIEDSPEDIKADKMLAKKLIKSKYAKGGTVGDEREDFDNEETKTELAKQSETPKKTLLQRYQENKGGYKRSLAGGRTKEGYSIDPKTGLEYLILDKPKVSSTNTAKTTQPSNSVKPAETKKPIVLNKSKEEAKMDSVVNAYKPVIIRDSNSGYPYTIAHKSTIEKNPSLYDKFEIDNEGDTLRYLNDNLTKAQKDTIINRNKRIIYSKPNTLEKELAEQNKTDTTKKIVSKKNPMEKYQLDLNKNQKTLDSLSSVNNLDNLTEEELTKHLDRLTTAKKNVSTSEFEKLKAMHNRAALKRRIFAKKHPILGFLKGEPFDIFQQ